jgi:hypothetical protein
MIFKVFKVFKVIKVFKESFEPEWLPFKLYMLKPMIMAMVLSPYLKYLKFTEIIAKIKVLESKYLFTHSQPPVASHLRFKS